MTRCPNVLAKIAEAKERLAQGRCWCDCVNDDIPNAEAKVAEGKCGAANSIIQAALARCTDPPQTFGGLQKLPKVELAPLPR